MAQATRKRIILVKPESVTYGVDSSPVATDAVLCSNLSITPLEGSSVERDFIRPYFGSSGAIRVENFASLSFDTEIAGSGAAGTAPEWGALLMSCNFSQTITAVAITGTTTAVSAIAATTVVLSSGATDDVYTGMTITFGGSATQYEIIKFVASTKVATLNKGLTAGVTAVSTFSIAPNVIYVPNSDFGTASPGTSSSIYFNVDGVQHVLLGARGTVSFDISAKAIPKMKWKFTGLLGAVSDIGLPSANFGGWQTPVTASAANTTDVNLLGYVGAVIQTLTFDIANTVIHRQLIGAESILITDRKPSGSISIEATSVATKNWWDLAKTAGTGPFSVKHGTVAGNIVGITAPMAQLKDPKYSDSDGVNMLDFGVELIPFSPAGNDEIRICSK